MTESEAIKICNTIVFATSFSNPQGIPLNTTKEELAEAMRIAIQALEKQTSKKPTPIDYEKYIDVIDNARFLRGAYWCPNCKRVVKSGSFCSDCGQKLDWIDEE